ncbi:MAG TPA: YfiR family protein [Permianibacter sp.]|nr:YfiR family protein [Permianibacter sp.]
MGWSGHTGWKLRWEPLRLLLSLLITVPAVLRADDNPAALSREYEVKAAFLFNFAKYGEWPAASLQVSPFRFCISGRPELATWLNQRLSGQRVHGLVVDVVDVASSLSSGCHLLFLTVDLPTERRRALIADSQQKPILIIGESIGVLDDGAVVRLFLDEGTVHFEVNLTNLGRQKLQLSSKLLRHADQVFGKNTSSGEGVP